MGALTARASLRGTASVPGDKSIAHRALLLSAFAEGECLIQGLPHGADVLATRDCLRELGISISEPAADGSVRVQGKGLSGLRTPRRVLDCRNSGTTARLLCGLLSAQRFSSSLDGDASLRGRPMARVVDPLRDMGSVIDYLEIEGRLPLRIDGARLPFTLHKPEVASAQVKSALLLASLAAGSGCRLLETVPIRDHSERMLEYMGSGLSREAGLIELPPGARLQACELSLPGDISSASFLIAAALLLPGSELLLRAVGVNPGRIGFIETLREMGADITLENQRLVCGEPLAEIHVRSSSLHATRIQGRRIPGIIDELPLLALLASQAAGTTEVRDAAELRLKESDRIESTAAMLAALGVACETLPDGFVVSGGQALLGGEVDSRGDHRIAMTAVVASLLADGEVEISDEQCIAVSFPGFREELTRLVN
ncbi:MAG: 3-phosphoshikimate 1-carboxyvinyltransferase [bacterium]